jgi:hypothetical protein
MLLLFKEIFLLMIIYSPLYGGAIAEVNGGIGSQETAVNDSTLTPIESGGALIDKGDPVTAPRGDGQHPYLFFHRHNSEDP